MYYHKLDADLLPKIRSQYLGPLRTRLETEQRGIEAMGPSARNDRQKDRLAELGDVLAELRDFDRALETVAGAGFRPEKAPGLLRQHAIAEAMNGLKARWLARLAGAIQEGPLAFWKAEARRQDLHPDLGLWIEEAVEKLPQHCTAVGREPPDGATCAEDPTAPSLAALLCAEAAGMVQGALRLVCGDWHGRLDRTVLAPLRAEIKEASSKKEKGRRKALDARLKDLVARAQALRNVIERWTSPDAATVASDLGRDPLYDRISSLDGLRAPPGTIADFIDQEGRYAPDLNDGVRVNLAPLQRAGLLAADVLDRKDLDKAVADRAEWRADERRWCREGKLPKPGWWPTAEGWA